MSEKFYVEGLREAVELEMHKDRRIFVAGEDVVSGSNYGEWKGFSQTFPARMWNTPISETAIVGLGVGAAAMGLRPICSMGKNDFMMVAMDEIVNQVSKFRYMYGSNVKLPMVLAAAYGVRRSQAAQHSQSLEAMFCHCPGIKVVIPSTAADAKGLMASSIRDDNPVIFMYSLSLLATKAEVPDGEYVVPLGSADVKREGADVTVISWGGTVLESLMAAETLAAEGVSAEVVDLRTLVPLDMETVLASVQKTGRVLVTHEAVEQGGYGGEIAARIADEGFNFLDAPVKRLGAPCCPVPYSPQLEELYRIDAPKIADAVRKLMAE